MMFLLNFLLLSPSFSFSPLPPLSSFPQAAICKALEQLSAFPTVSNSSIASGAPKKLLKLMSLAGAPELQLHACGAMTSLVQHVPQLGQSVVSAIGERLWLALKVSC